MSNDDHALLREFTTSRSEAAFGALVNRYLPLVHSAALRRTEGDTHQAEEIAQAVFILLARKAGSIGERTVLAGWLYRATYYVAGSILRQNLRRQQREQQAYRESTMNQEIDTEESWKQLAPVLDDAMNTLREADRDAVLLRYFENKSLAEVGAALGVSEDAARVRVNRAMEKLRSLLTKQGVTLAGAAIAGSVTANAVQAVPATLATAITTTTLTTGTGLTIATITMTTLQKITVTVALTATIGAGIYEAKQSSDARTEAQTLRLQQSQWADQLQKLQAEHARATNAIALLNLELSNRDKNNEELLKLRGQVGVLQNSLQQAKQGLGDSNDPTTTAARAWLERVKLLKDKFAKWPGKPSPELQLLTEQDWLDAVSKTELESDEACRATMGKLRLTAQEKLSKEVVKALEDFSKENDGRVPTDLSQLKSYVTSAAGAVLDTYDIAKPGWVHPPQPNAPQSENAKTWAIVMKGSFTVDGKAIYDGSYLSDPEYDMSLVIYSGGYYMYGQPKRGK